ncbi:AraC family transcriptional regulator [Paenibacillus ginsengihumi]|uniref:AraC family transcriptional regulator n=1 Tax=Paenibacillus ginsengihumi TaxID=431596 RepID=UPI00036004DA|nr:GyrI-like domain-containing protein [Paenibacillus ginsengihumi]
MEMTIETLPQYRIAYVRQVGPYGPANIQAMEKLKGWARSKNLLTESAILFGIPQDNPETTPPETCRYDACIVISQDVVLDDAISEGMMSGGEYAVFKVKHTAEDVQKAWADCFPALQRKGYQMDKRPVMERYVGELVKNHLCEICVPVRPLPSL